MLFILAPVFFHSIFLILIFSSQVNHLFPRSIVPLGPIWSWWNKRLRQTKKKIIESLIRVQLFARSDFRWKQSLCDHIYLNMLYTVMKSYSSMLILSLRKQMFAEIGYYLPMKSDRINIIVSLLFHRDYFSFTLQSYIQKEKFLLNIFIHKKSLKNLLHVNLKWNFTDQAKMARKRQLSLVFWLWYLK
jgi:hypothetical protein